MKSGTWLGLLATAIVAIGGCSNDAAKPSACGATTCSERQICATSSVPAQCVCREAFTGSDCSSCARGYQLGEGGACVPPTIECAKNPGVCGSHGTCISIGGAARDICKCESGYAGLLCQTCEAGYQDNNHDGRCTPACSATTCPAAQTCSDATGTARCACSGNRIGTNCDQCPSGWVLRATDDVCVQTCTASASSCGSRKTCDPTQGICICQPEYSGDACDVCAPGYQDNDSNGTCRASCASTTCSAGQTCSDTSGTARCACPPNRTGTNCAQCSSGWVLRPSDNTCVQTCASLSCGARRTCEESQGAPMCVCQAGYTGTDCATCATGYLSDGAGQCVRTAPAGTTLIGAGQIGGGQQLLAINPDAGAALPLRTLTGLAGQRLSSDLASRTLYTVNGSGISLLDPTTGELAPVAAVQSTATLAFGAGALYTFGQLSPYLLKKIEPDTGAVSDIGPTNLPAASGSAGLVWEAAGTLLFARPTSTAGASAEFFRIDPQTAVATPLGTLASNPEGLRPKDARLGLAFDATGRLFMATRQGRTPVEIVAEHCRQLAAGLGYVGYEAAPITSAEIAYEGIGPGGTRVLSSKNTSGKELVTYASYGRRSVAKAILRIGTTNPEAFVCASTYEEVLEVQVPPSVAAWKAIAVVGYRPTLTLVVEGAVPPVTAPTLHVHAPSGSVAPAFDGASGGYQFSRTYSASEWNALRLPGYVAAWDTDDGAPSVLLELDPATRVVTRIVSFPGVDLFPTIAPWAP